MILVLCNSFEEAQDGYDVFVQFLEENEPWSIRNAWNCSYCVETDDDLRYIFIDRRMKNIFYAFDRPDEIDLDVFLRDTEEFYFAHGLEVDLQ